MSSWDSICPNCGAKKQGRYRTCCDAARKRRDAGRLAAERRDEDGEQLGRTRSYGDRLSEGFELLDLGDDEYIDPYEP